MPDTPSDSTLSDYIIHIIGVIIFVIVVGFLLLSCQTIEAVTAAPEEFWVTLEVILAALWADVMSIVDLVL